MLRSLQSALVDRSLQSALVDRSLRNALVDRSLQSALVDRSVQSAVKMNWTFRPAAAANCWPHPCVHTSLCVTCMYRAGVCRGQEYVQGRSM